jgi:flagellar biosynthesis protein FlhF
MRLKSYFAATVEAAMHQARVELGDDAMLLDSRPTGPQAKHLGSYEVVFALPETVPSPAVTVPGASKALPSKESPRLAADLELLRRELDRVRSSVVRSSSLAAAAAGLFHRPEVARCYSELVANDMLPEIAQELIVSCSGSQARNGGAYCSYDELRESVLNQISQRLRVLPQAGCGAKRLNPVVCMIGPPGAGKTSALVKLAISQGLPSRKPMLFVSLDNLRVGGGQALLHYATLVGATYLSADSGRQLCELVAEHRHKYWIWVDTPGFGPRETDAIAELSEFVRSIPEIDTHLVLSVAMKSSDLRVAATRFAPLEPKKLLFAHLDETETYGGILSAVVASSLPVSFLCTGQQIPEAIEPAQVSRLLALLAEGNCAAVSGLAHAGRAVAGQ